MSDSSLGKSVLKQTSSGFRNVAGVEQLEREVQEQAEEEEEEESDSSDQDDDDLEDERGISVKFKSERSLASVKVMTDRSGRVYDDWADIGYFLRYWDIGFVKSKSLTSLRDRLKDVKDPLNRPGVVVRFLIQEKFNVSKAERQFRAMIEWTSNRETLKKGYHPPPELLEKYPGAMMKGTDHDDDPVYVSRLGITDLSGLTDKYGKDEMLNYEIFRRESTMYGTWQKEWSIKAGRPFRDILVIEDLCDLSPKDIPKAVAAIFGAADLDQTYYPCVAKKIVIIRAPAHFRAAWTLAKRSIPKAIRETIRVYGNSDYLKRLEAYVDLDLLPPSINPDGKGELIEGMSSTLKGGEVG